MIKVQYLYDKGTIYMITACHERVNTWLFFPCSYKTCFFDILKWNKRYRNSYALGEILT